jgi:hypothetical protein
VTRVGYGLSQTLQAFAGQTGLETGEQLRALGFVGVFVKSYEAEWIAGLKESGLKVYASLTCFMGAGVWQRFPGSRPILPDGSPAPRDDWYEPAIPTLPELRQARLAQLDHLAQTLPLDGIWLDFIRWPARWEKPELSLYHSSFDALTLSQFQRDTGLAPPEGAISHWLSQNVGDPWFSWRCKQIASFVALAREHLKVHLPEALLGVFTIPWTDSDCINGISAPNIRIVGQDLQSLQAHADVLSPMVYHRLCGKTADWPTQVTRFVREHTNGPVWPVIEVLREDLSYPVAEFEAVARGAIASGADALVVFNLDGLLAHSDKLTLWQTAWPGSMAL